MKQFTNTIEKLKTDKFHAVRVVAIPSLKVIANNLTGEQMVEQYGSVDAFFDGLPAKGITSFKVYDRRKTGSAFRPLGEYDVNATENTNLPMNVSQAIPAIPMGLTGGMNGTDFYRAMDYPKLSSENQVLKVENAAQKAEIAKLEKEILQHEFSTNKADSTKDMIMGLAPLLAPLLGKFMPVAEAVSPIALARPGENLSETKNQVINIIKTVDEDTAYYIGLVAKTMHNENFQAELFSLLDRYTITQKAM